MTTNIEELNEILCKFDIIAALIKTMNYAFEYCINNDSKNIAHIFELANVINEKTDNTINELDNFIIAHK